MSVVVCHAGRADVRRHDDDGVLEVDFAALRVGQTPVFEHLQQQVEDVGMRFLDLVEQHDRVRTAAHGFGQLTAFFVADVSRRRADQTRDRVLLHVLRHVDADHRLFVVEQELGDAARDFGLADAGRSEEDERADRAIGVLQPGARTADRPRDDVDRRVLADDALVQLLVHVEQLLGLGLREPADRDLASTPRRCRRCFVGDLQDVVALRALRSLPLLFEALLLEPQLLLAVANRGGLLELLVLDDRFFFAR